MDNLRPITEEELQYLRDTVEKRVLNFKDEVWRRAFSIFNESPGNSLSPSCGNCYAVVLALHEAISPQI